MNVSKVKLGGGRLGKKLYLLYTGKERGRSSDIPRKNLGGDSGEQSEKCREAISKKGT